MTIDIHTLIASLPNQAELENTSGQITVDESWSPYVQMTLTCAIPDDLSTLDQIDPRAGGRLFAQAQQDFGDPWSNADFTDRYGAVSNAALTAALGNVPNRTITSLFFVAWNEFGQRDSTVREFGLSVRSRVIDHVAGEVRITAASDEALLQDYKLLDTVKYINPTATTLRALTAFVLALIGATLQPGTDDAVVAANATEWLPGTSAWDYLAPTVEKAALRLWCDENRRWWLTQRAPIVPGQLTLRTGAGGTISRATDTIDRDGDWYAGVCITYQWNDSAGLQHVAYDVAGDPRSVLAITRDQPYPGPGAAAQILKQSAGRGRVLDLAAVSDYRATPGQAFTAGLPGTPAQTGIVSAVTWRFPDAEMDVKTRGLIDTPASAWVFDPAGIRWVDIPAGIDWTEDI